MRREKVFNRSLLILAIMSIMLFAMTITASAASGRAVTNLQQTDDTKTSVTVQWSGNYGEEYLVYLSQDRSSGYQALSSYTSTSNKKYIYNLQAGRAYYVIVQTYVNKQLVGQSDPLQVITTPESVDYKSIKQTSGTKNKIGLQWNRVSGVTGYVVAKISGSKVEAQYNVPTNKATVPAKAGTHYSGYYVYSYKRSESNYIALGYGQSLTVGYISALDREITDENGIQHTYIQTDAAINPGNSGGALLNTAGEVIGINSVKYSDTSVEGIGYAIPMDTAKPIIEELITKEKVDESNSAYLGIVGVDVTSDVAKTYNMPTGVYVAQVMEGAAAEQAGIQKGDIITKFDGKDVTSMEELSSNMQYYAAGTTVDVVIERSSNGQYEEQTISVTLGKKN